MSSLICRVIHYLHLRPKSVLLFSLVMSLISLFFIQKIEVKFKILDLFPENLKSVETSKTVQSKFGSFAKFSIIIQSDNPSENIAFAQRISNPIDSLSIVHFTEYETESEFLENNKILYIPLKDLKKIKELLNEEINKKKEKYNPFIVNFATNDTTQNLISKIQQLERKYNPNLRPYIGNKENSILVLNVYPNFETTHIQLATKLFDNINRIIKDTPKPEDLNIYFYGDPYENVVRKKITTQEIQNSIWISLSIIFGLLLFFFYRQPMVPLLTIFPLAVGAIWTLGFISIAIGYVDLATIILSIIILGMGMDSVIHLLARYGEERRKSLGPEIAFENIILETGPAVTTSSFTTAISLFCLSFIPFKGFSHFGLVAGFGMLFIWLSIMLNFPAMLIILQKKSTFKVYGKKILNHHQFRRRPYKHWYKSIPILLFTLVIMYPFGFYPQFEYNFNKLGFHGESQINKQLIKQTNDVYQSPAIIYARDSIEAHHILHELEILRNKPNSTIQKIISKSLILPRKQKERLAIGKEIQQLLTQIDEVMLNENQLSFLKKMQQTLETASTVQLSDIPHSLRRKFESKHSDEGEFIFVFPREDTNEGLYARKFAYELKSIQFNSSPIDLTGKGILIADFLDLTLPHLGAVLAWSLLLISILLYNEQRKLKNTLIILTPVLIGFLFLLGFLNMIGFHFNSLNIFLFPLLIGLNTDSVIHLFHRYQEEKTGSLFFVLRRTGLPIMMATFTSIIGFIGLMFSTQTGLYSIGILSLYGLVFSFLTSFVIFPVIMGFFDHSRWRKNQPAQ